jgi:hypothetical protein
MSLLEKPSYSVYICISSPAPNTNVSSVHAVNWVYTNGIRFKLNLKILLQLTEKLHVYDYVLQHENNTDARIYLK